MDRVSKVLEEKYGVPQSTIKQSIIETSELLNLPALKVYMSILEAITSYKLTIVSWNILADIWYGDQGTIEKRRFKKILNTLRSIILDCNPDVILLQEVTRSKYLILKKVLHGYVSHISYHSKQHWRNQLILSYEPNGTCIFIKEKFKPDFSTLSLGGGNFSSVVKILVGSDMIHIVNVHLNDDNVDHIREKEVSTLLGAVNDQNMTYIIGGDLNSLPKDIIHQLFLHKGFETICFEECKIDYIYLRDKRSVMIPIGLSDAKYSTEMLIEQNGSDHPPVGTEIFFGTN